MGTSPSRGEHHRAGRQALVGVADDAHVAALGGEHEDELVLHPVGVLVLVDEHVAEPALVASSTSGNWRNSSTVLRSRSSKSMAPALRRRAWYSVKTSEILRSKIVLACSRYSIGPMSSFLAAEMLACTERGGNFLASRPRSRMT